MTNPIDADPGRTLAVLEQMKTNYQTLIPQCYLRFFERHVSHLVARANGKRMLQGGRHAAR